MASFRARAVSDARSIAGEGGYDFLVARKEAAEKDESSPHGKDLKYRRIEQLLSELDSCCLHLHKSAETNITPSPSGAPSKHD